MKQIYKEHEGVTIFGSNKPIRLDMAMPEWANEPSDYFVYKGHRYYLSEFVAIANNLPDWMKEFDGYAGDSYFSGVLVKLGKSEDGEDDIIRAYTYIT